MQQQLHKVGWKPLALVERNKNAIKLSAVSGASYEAHILVTVVETCE